MKFSTLFWSLCAVFILTAPSDAEAIGWSGSTVIAPDGILQAPGTLTLTEDLSPETPYLYVWPADVHGVMIKYTILGDENSDLSQLSDSSSVGSRTSPSENLGVTSVPEPGALALTAVGLAGIATWRLRRSK